MIALKCELCGGNELIKQDGMYVCPFCGTKYTTEEAKKLIISGTVKIDNTSDIENWLTLAKRAKDSGNWDEAKEYYKRVLEKDPNNVEAYLEPYYMDCMANINTYWNLSQAQATFFEKVILELATEEDRTQAARYAFRRTYEVFTEKAPVAITIAGYPTMNGKSEAEADALLEGFIKLFGDTCSYIINMDIKDEATQTELRNMGLKGYKFIVDTLATAINNKTLKLSGDIDAWAWSDEIDRFVEKIRKIDPSYQPPKIKPKMKLDKEFRMGSGLLCGLVFLIIILWGCSQS